MTGHGVVASYGLYSTYPWLSVTGTAFGVLFLSMNIGGGVLVWMRESAELQARPQRTPFWMLEHRSAFDDSVAPTSSPRREAKSEMPGESKGQQHDVTRTIRKATGSKLSGTRGTRHHRVSQSPAVSPRRGITKSAR